MPNIRPETRVFFLRSKPLFKIKTMGKRKSAPNVVLMPVKVNASMDFMPISWATNEEPQIMAVIRRNIMPLGVVLRIAVLYHPFPKCQHMQISV